jgi:uncharacterized repeat protein (TIGR03837 family)
VHTRWWILCRVVDNFGDAGVAWRLARQLAREHRALVTLFIDRPDLVERLAGNSGHCAGVTLRRWPGAADASLPGDRNLPAGDGPAARPDVVVSAFGCEPPARIRQMLAGAPARPLWVNLEYLSAEDWVDGCHGLVSVKPADGAVEHFFYPGFGPATGGLLRERDAVAPDDPPPPGERAAALKRLSGVAPAEGERVITLFCYPVAPLDAWLPALADGDRPTLLLVPEGVADEGIGRFAGRPIAPGDPTPKLGRLRIARIPFLSQDGYDALLRLADLNFVRGEDSWIRAHWARRPFVWQPYPQEAGAHRVKLAAFLARMRRTATAADGNAGAIAPAGSAEAIEVIERMMRAWSGDGDPAAAWRAFEARLASLPRAYRRWTDSLIEQPDLVTRLARWLAHRL